MKPYEVASYLIENRRSTRTRRGHPCPVCQHSDSHCLRMDDDSAALCPKVDGSGSVKRYGEYGYLYILRDDMLEAAQLPPVKKVRQRTDAELDAIWQPRVERWRERERGEVGRLASKLGVSVSSLKYLVTGWDGKAWTFPERNGTGLIVGVSRRFEDGSKRCAVGSRRGLTYSVNKSPLPGPVLIVEGASDVAAGLTLFMKTVGRPSNVGGREMLAVLLRKSRRKLIVIGERDKKDDGRWPGMEGCRTVAAGLGKSLGRMVSAKLLPDNAKDLRAWLRESGVDVGNSEACREVGKQLQGELKP